MNRSAILVIAALLPACTTTAATPPAALDGTAWTFVSIDGAAPASSRAALRFEADRLSATAGCNGLGGTWRIENGRLHGGPYASTMMFCDGLMEQERALAALLAEKPLVRRDRDRLTLRSAGHSAELRRSE